MPSRASGEAPARLLQIALEVELLGERVGRGGGERALGEPQRVGRRRRQLARHRCDLGLQLVVVDALPDQAPGLGLLGAEWLGQHGKAARAGGADEARQRPGAAGVGDEADAGEGLQEAGAARGVHQVAGQRDVGAGAGGDAVDGADDRLLQRGDQLDQRIVGLLQPAAGIGARSVGRARRPRPGPGRPRRPGRRRSAPPPGTADRRSPPPVRHAARHAWPSVKALSLSGRLSVSRVTPPFLRNQDRLAAHVQVLLDFGRHTATFSLPTAACHRGWADRPRRLGMAGPVVYSAAATEPRAILRKYPAVQMLVSGPLETRMRTAAGRDQEEDTERAAISGA